MNKSNAKDGDRIAIFVDSNPPLARLWLDSVILWRMLPANLTSDVRPSAGKVPDLNRFPIRKRLHQRQVITNESYKLVVSSFSGIAKAVKVREVFE